MQIIMHELVNIKMESTKILETNLLLGLKKDVCLPFSDRPKISENKGQLFFKIFLFSVLHF